MSEEKRRGDFEQSPVRRTAAPRLRSARSNHGNRADHQTLPSLGETSSIRTEPSGTGPSRSAGLRPTHQRAVLRPAPEPTPDARSYNRLATARRGSGVRSQSSASLRRLRHSEWVLLPSFLLPRAAPSQSWPAIDLQRLPFAGHLRHSQPTCYNKVLLPDPSDFRSLQDFESLW